MKVIIRICYGIVFKRTYLFSFGVDQAIFTLFFYCQYAGDQLHISIFGRTKHFVGFHINDDMLAVLLKVGHPAVTSHANMAGFFKVEWNQNGPIKCQDAPLPILFGVCIINSSTTAATKRSEERRVGKKYKYRR